MNNRKYIILLALVLLIVIGYAALSGTLDINGTTKITANTWDIHFENIQINSNSVPIGTGDSAAIVNPSDNTEVNYSITLSLPGDFYEFNVDVKNAGTIDGMIDSIVSTLKINNNEPITIAGDKSNLPPYLDYSITYVDGGEILANHELNAGTKETYKIRVEFKKDITNDQLPGEDNTLSFSMKPIMMQRKLGAVPPRPIITNNYMVLNGSTIIGQEVPNDVILNRTFDEARSEWQYVTNSEDYLLPFLLNYKLDENNIVTEGYIAFVINDEIKEERKEECYNDQECLDEIDNLVNGFYQIKGNDPSAYESNVNIIKQAFNYSVQPQLCNFDDYNNSFSCGNGMLLCNVSTSMDGQVDAATGGFHCNIYTDGSSACEFQ